MVICGIFCNPSWLPAQLEELELREGASVPESVEKIYDLGLSYLSKSQKKNGSWGRGSDAPAVSGLVIMAFLSSGEDPNFGKYAPSIRKGLRFIIKQQKRNGFIPGTMYVHGFATLSLAEAYGALDDEMLWQGASSKGRSIGEALEKAVKFAVTTQRKNPSKAWRYMPTTTDADTSVAGAVLMGLLAARNAGIDVPDDSIDGALKYFRSMTARNGMVAYSGMGSMGAEARSCIGCLVFAIGKRKGWKQYDWTKRFVGELQGPSSSWPFYQRYYHAQALFQSDYEVWKKWNGETIRKLQNMQRRDGQIAGGGFGSDYATSMSLLALALNYRFLPIYER